MHLNLHSTLLISFICKDIEICTADVNREKPEFGLKKRKKKRNLKKERKISEKKKTPAPAPRFTDTSSSCDEAQPLPLKGNTFPTYFIVNVCVNLFDLDFKKFSY